MGTTARRASTQNLNTCAPNTYARLVSRASNLALDREEPNVDNSLRSVIGSLAGSLAILVIVCVAAWIVIRTGSGHSSWQ
jgi:hypothetical protein